MKTAFRVGDRVAFNLGRRRVEGVVIEDRGPLGVEGRRIYQVEVPRDPFDPATYELAEDVINAASANGKEKPLDPAAVVDYLRQGGLASILRANVDGGRNEPRVWLRLDTLGNITHTFHKERGRLGGETVPAKALADGGICSAKRDELLGFLRSFGLNHAQAKSVLDDISVAPAE